MRFAIVKSSDLGDRWDPKFHVLREELKEETAKLEAAMSAEAAIALLQKLPLSELTPLLDLSRQASPRLTREQMERIISAYPHFSLAIMRPHLDAAKARVKAKIASLEAEIVDIETVAKEIAR